MISVLPEELFSSLNDRFQCREAQIRHLCYLLSPQLPNPSTIVIHGPEATCKSSIIGELLQHLGCPHVIIPSQECITGRHLLERTLLSCLQSLRDSPDLDSPPNLYNRCESISVLAVQIQGLLEGHDGRFVLVFDGIDRQREVQPTLLPALARLGEFVSNLTVILIVTSPRPRLLHMTGVPHINFPPYNREQSLQILDREPPSIFETPVAPDVNYTEEEAVEDNAWVWTRFCAVVWDSLGKGAARDIVNLRAAAHKLWRPFVAPIVDGTYGTRDFSRLLVAKRSLFQGDAVLVDHVVPPMSTASTDAEPLSRRTHDLPYYAKFLLCAAYLASYNPARQDPIFFMRSTEKKRRKKRGGTAVGRGAKHRKIQRRLLGPQAFPLERLLAIFQAVNPQPVILTADILMQVATLASLRLLLRAGAASIDALNPSAKWRVNVNWEHVHQLARSIGLEIADYLAD